MPGGELLLIEGATGDDGETYHLRTAERYSDLFPNLDLVDTVPNDQLKFNSGKQLLLFKKGG